MKFHLLLLTAIFIQYSATAQKNPAPLPDSTVILLNLEEIVVSANNFTEKKKNVAQKIDVISASDIVASNAQNTGDLLANTGKIFVQKSQQGGSSPVIRGFEASRILLVIDGVRMNNAIYRSGHLQNVITVDQNSLSRVEIMYGPASTIYGSDALGGIIHLITKSPVLSGNQTFLSTGSAFSRYSTANNEKTIHADMSIGGKKIYEKIERKKDAKLGECLHELVFGLILCRRICNLNDALGSLNRSFPCQSSHPIS